MSTSTSSLTVRHEPESDRFVGELDGTPVTVAEYREIDGVLVLHHTETDPDHGGQGYAKQVVVAALDHARTEGKQVVPACWFAAEVLHEEPQYRDLVAA